MIFDSNTRINTEDYQSSLKKLSNKLIKYKINKAICILCSKSKKYNVEEFLKEISTYKNLTPVIELRKKDCNLNFLKYLKKIGVKAIKIHPRNLNCKYSNQKFYKTLLKNVHKFNFLVLWCTLDSWENYYSVQDDQINLLSDISNNNKRLKIILMHGGSSNLLRYYEKFRFNKNMYIDLSYTIDKFKKTSILNDIVFLLNNFNKRITMGTDYPDITFQKHYQNLRYILKKNKILKSKSKYFLNLNLDKILNET